VTQPRYRFESRAIAERSTCRLSLIARNAQLRERAVRVLLAGEAGCGMLTTAPRGGCQVCNMLIVGSSRAGTFGA
jgi:hypothetical protein